MTLISRDKAIELGLDRYKTGKPCVNGHVSERRVNGRSCVECNRVNAARRRKPRLDQKKQDLVKTLTELGTINRVVSREYPIS